MWNLHRLQILTDQARFKIVPKDGAMPPLSTAHSQILTGLPSKVIDRLIYKGIDSIYLSKVNGQVQVRFV